MAEERLRERQAAQVREAILQVLVRHLEAGDADELSMEGLAGEAGVSRRTLYRYFPTRPALLAAAAEWVRDQVLRVQSEIGPQGIVASFRAGVAGMRDHPALARALLETATGRAVRGGYRAARVESIRRVVRQEGPTLPEAEVARAAAVLSYLCSLTSWSMLQEEAGLDGAAAQEAVEWAIEVVLTAVRAGSRAAAEALVVA